MATTSRGWRKVADNENDKAQAVNDALDDASADLTNVAATATAADAKAQAALDNGGNGAGVPQGAVTLVNVLANRAPWTDSGVDFTGEDALWLEASGAISHQAAPSPTYGPYHSGGAYLVWVLVADGSVPDGDVAAQNDFRLHSTAYRKLGRLWLRIRDVGGSGDNQGAFDVKVHRFADPGEALTPLADYATTRAELVALTIRVATLEAQPA